MEISGRVSDLPLQYNVAAPEANKATFLGTDRNLLHSWMDCQLTPRAPPDAAVDLAKKIV